MPVSFFSVPPRPSIWGLWALLMVWCCASSAQMRFTSAPDNRFSKSTAQQVLTQAYAQLGLNVEFVPLPVRRGYAVAALGELDGLTLSAADDIDPKLIKVNVPVAFEETVVYTRNQQFKVDGFESLRPYTVGHVAGLRYFEENLRDMKADPGPDLNTVLRKLSLGRTDIALDTRSSQCKLRTLDLPDIRILEPPLSIVKAHHFLHIKHAQLVPRLQTVLARMEADGTLKRIQTAAFKEFQRTCGE